MGQLLSLYLIYGVNFYDVLMTDVALMLVEQLDLPRQQLGYRVNSLAQHLDTEAEQVAIMICYQTVTVE
jgi:hypothetical protein